jgi:hypothetical protein
LTNNYNEQSREEKLVLLKISKIIVILFCTISIGVIFGILHNRVYLDSLENGEYEPEYVVHYLYSFIAFFVLGIVCTSLEAKNKDGDSILEATLKLATIPIGFGFFIFVIELLFFSIKFGSVTGAGRNYFGQNLSFFIIVAFGDILSFFLGSGLIVSIICLFRILVNKKIVKTKKLERKESINFEKTEPLKEHTMKAIEQGFCMICKLEIRPGQEIVRCPYCQASFHKDHFKSWFKTHDNCPVCNRKIDHKFTNNKTKMIYFVRKHGNN